MKKNLFVKSGLLASVCAVFFVGQANAVDLAEAAGVMAEVESMSVAAKASLASAALDGDAEAVAEAKKRSDAIDTAVASARDAYSQLEISVNSGDTDAAETAGDDLANALQQVRDALMGAIPEELLAQAEEAQSKQKAGGKPGDPNNPPNLHEVPWKSQGIKAYYEGLFGHFWNAQAFGHGQGFGDRDATPQ